MSIMWSGEKEAKQGTTAFVVRTDFKTLYVHRRRERKKGKGKNGMETEVQRVCKTLVKGTYYPVGRFVYTLVVMQVRERES